MNEDTSTNNLPEFFWYCRESVSSKSRQVFAFYYIWAFVGGAIVFITIVLAGVLVARG